MERDNQILTVSDLTSQIKEIVEGSFPLVWIEGEVSNFTHHRSGHMYFTLKDEQAELRSVMFRGLNQFIRFKPEEGMKIIAQGKISVYQQRGQYQLMVQQMEPAGIGTLYLAFESLKKQLLDEGIFDLKWKKELPPFPKTIGIITSSSGAAIQDIIQILSRRAPHVNVVIRSTLVQGIEAAADIVQAIKEFQTFQNIDVLIIGRGGGSLEDLWSFNEEKVARAIFECTIPIISAVGHETDVTIADFVADVRTPTPSAAAELVSPSRKKIYSQLDQMYSKISQALLNQMQEKWQNLDNVTNKASYYNPGKKIADRKLRLDSYIHHMIQSTMYGMNMSKSRIMGFQEILSVLSPQNVLERGYSIATTIPEKEIIRSPNILHEGDPFRVLTGQGYFSAVKTGEKTGN